MNRVFIISLGIWMLFASCTAARKTHKKQASTNDTIKIENNKNNSKNDTPPKNGEEKTNQGREENLVSTFVKKINKIEFTTFIGKADVDYSGGGKDFSFEAKIQMEKGKIIWISCLGPLGIEIARGIITQDSVHIMNKWEKNYTSRSLSFLQQQLGMPLTLLDVQDVLIGNAVLIDEKNIIMTNEDNQVVLKGENQKMKTAYNFKLPGTLISKLLVQDKKDSTKNATLIYNDYIQTNGVYFPKSRVIDVNDKSKLNVKMKFNSYSLNQNISTPFSIPKSYTKK